MASESRSPESLPLLSVVIPTYNRCESLRATLDGLTRQTYPADRFEVVVVSDGATDGTEDMLRSRSEAASDPFTLRPIFQANGGPSRARNRGITEARNEIVVFLDDDVEPAPHFLSAHAAYHIDAADLAVIGPMLQAPDRRWHEPVWIAWEHSMLEKQYEQWRTGRWTAVGPNHFYSGNASLRREHLVRVGGFDETFKRQEDVELAYRLARECGVRFAFDAEASVLHRPVRRFESWLAIPYAYGHLDVTQAVATEARGDAAESLWEALRWKAFTGRNRITRQSIAFLMSGVLPAESSALRNGIVALSRALYGMRVEKPAFAMLSLVYNLRYAEGVLKGLNGSRSALACLLRENDVAAARAAASPVTDERGGMTEVAALLPNTPTGVRG